MFAVQNVIVLFISSFQKFHEYYRCKQAINTVKEVTFTVSTKDHPYNTWYQRIYVVNVLSKNSDSDCVI